MKYIYVCTQMYICLCNNNNNKEDMNFKKKISIIWDGLDGGEGMEKSCNYIVFWQCKVKTFKWQTQQSAEYLCCAIYKDKMELSSCYHLHVWDWTGSTVWPEPCGRYLGYYVISKTNSVICTLLLEVLAWF